MSYRIYDAAGFANRIANNEQAFFADIMANPGTDKAGIRLRLSKAENLTTELLSVLEERRLIVCAYDTSGTPFYWEPGAWAQAIFSKRADARTWLANNSGNTVAQLASALGVHEAIANALAEGLRSEGKARLIPV